MNILYLCANPQVTDRDRLSPAERTRAVCSAFARAGHLVTLMTIDSDSTAWSGLPVRIVSVAAPWSAEDDDDEEWDWTAGTRFSEAAETVLVNGAYDLILEQFSTVNDTGARLSAAYGLPLILEVAVQHHATPERRSGKRVDHLSRWILYRQLKAATVVIVPANEVREHAIAHGVDSHRIHLLSDASEDPQTGIVPEESFWDGYAARIVSWAREAAASRPDANLPNM